MKRYINYLKNQVYKSIENLIFNNKFRQEFYDLKSISGQTALLASTNQKQSSSDLWDYEVKVYSQWGEDGILNYLSERTNLYKPKILEIGVGDFTECNSRALVEFKNASAYLVDIDQGLKKVINNSELKWKNHLEAEILWASPSNINQIVRRASEFMTGIDIISLDIDGIDFWVMKEMNIPQSVRIIVAEYNPLFGHSHRVSVPYVSKFNRSEAHYSHLYFGCSISAYIHLMESKGFIFVGSNRAGNNAFFLQQKFIEATNLRPRKDLSLYTDWRIRESRNPEGILDYLSGDNRLYVVKDELIYNLIDDKIIPIKQLFNI